LPAANAVYFNRILLHIEFAEDERNHPDQFGVGKGMLNPEYFNVNLMELSEPPFLRTFMPEHSACSKKFHYFFLCVKAFLKVMPYHPCGRLRSQCKGIASEVGKCKHLLFDNVGRITYAPYK
jgi:hypothetical protein